ncbi:MAG: histidine phosphatase family protein [Desulfobacterales bacterium]|nr:histidine phosphatase family protein [Desulfobacterales bacterium]
MIRMDEVDDMFPNSDLQTRTRFGLLRHARTAWNMEKRIQGREDSPLTEEGEADARTWGVVLKPHGYDRIITSDLGRALRTAALINTFLGVPVTTSPLLREMDWGEWGGKTLKQIRTASPGRLEKMERAGWEFRPPGGENRGEALERGRRALVEAARRWPGRKILVVTHGGMIKCLVYRLLNRRFLPEEPGILRPDHLHQLICDQEELALEKVNARCSRAANGT